MKRFAYFVNLFFSTAPSFPTSPKLVFDNRFIGEANYSKPARRLARLFFKTSFNSTAACCYRRPWMASLTHV